VFATSRLDSGAGTKRLMNTLCPAATTSAPEIPNSGHWSSTLTPAPVVTAQPIAQSAPVASVQERAWCRNGAKLATFSSMAPARPPVVSQTEWDAALAAITEREQTVATAMHQLAAARKRMPMVRVEHDYRFEGPDGQRSLPELFDGRSQLIFYRFFFEEGVDGWPDAGCAGCSSVADGIPDLGLLHARDITFAMASPAPQANLRRYAERMGWTNVPWYTICTERFSADFGVDEWFGLNVFLRDGDDVYRTYFLQHGPMVQSIGSIWSMFSLTPYGGQSDDEDAPAGWPQAPHSFWYRRHDEYDEPAPSARSRADADDDQT
jgi:predicted dithiol-disulfide oxidoreductase (DUF899 family)